MKAARNGSVRVARMLLDMGADPFLKNRKGETALDIARSVEARKVVKLLEERMKKRRRNDRGK